MTGLREAELSVLTDILDLWDVCYSAATSEALEAITSFANYIKAVIEVGYM